MEKFSKNVLNDEYVTNNTKQFISLHMQTFNTETSKAQTTFNYISYFDMIKYTNIFMS